MLKSFVFLSILQVRMYAPLEQIDQVEYASKITDKLFTFYENYFEIKYALPKSGKTSNNQTNRTRVKDKKKQKTYRYMILTQHIPL